MFGLEMLGGAISSPPTVPRAPQVNLSSEQAQAVSANQRILPQAETLASGVNAFNQEQLQKMLEGAIPMYNSLISGVSGNIESMLKGQLPKDVADQIQNSAAGKALAGGYAGTGMANALTARDLGLNSLNLINQGISSAQSWLATMKSVATPQQFDVTSMFVTPGQMAANEWQNENARFQRNWLQNQLKNAYSINNVLGSGFITTDAQLAQIASSLAGSAGGAAIACWVAREVYGVNNPKWLQFRHWMLNKAPALFRKVYLKYGARFAKFISDKPRLKHLIRLWMDTRITA